jgi:hypothetical protein
MRSTEAMKRHGTEPVGVNAVPASDRSCQDGERYAGVCPQEANTPEKSPC